MKRVHRFFLAAFILLQVLPAVCWLRAQDGADAAAHDALARRWRDHVLPTPEETAWERIPWLPSFAAGILAADAQQRPLLLWVMNGHPLGCT